MKYTAPLLLALLSSCSHSPPPKVLTKVVIETVIEPVYYETHECVRALKTMKVRNNKLNERLTECINKLDDYDLCMRWVYGTPPLDGYND